MAAVRIGGYAIIGFFIGFVLAISIENFARSQTDISSGIGALYEGPAWAVLWLSLPPVIAAWALPIFGAICGVVLAIS